MNCKNVFSLKLLGTAIILSITVFSCTSNDTTGSTAAQATVDTTAMASDTPMMSKTADATPVTKVGTAKPNPAKKGLKGKVTILLSPAPNTEAKMEADNTGVYSNVEIIPSFPGGNKGMQKYFDDNLKYPEDAGRDGVEGTVNLTFVVDENGKLTLLQVAGEYLGYGLDEEALRVVSTMPVWNPGKLKGKNVKTRFTLPIRFVLE